ncbi:hypothetical protein J1N35_027031 [Gossypium stocksii]|uniref:RNase H type-1 domain-containing protein n=1 Tax=Gossypium stocksii TaxID=47602 RepID=A0A9D3ZZT2_9ROSI|nr:hypothetical protein J1N35_027031 [Gossypium stocksii]
MVFENKVIMMDTLIFHSKMRALLWVRAAFDECRVQERLWWFCLYKCKFSLFDSRGWLYPPHGWLKFNVSGLAIEGALGVGGMLRDEEGIVRALFSRPTDACDAESAELGAISTALDIFIEFGWEGHGSLVIEIGSRVVYNWILVKARRPWSHQVISADLERRFFCFGKLSFSIAEVSGNEMAESLAMAGMSRTCMFKAWW